VVIEGTDGSVSSSVILVRKKNWNRFCVDCRKLNDVKRNDCFPLPRIDDTLVMLAGAICFSSLELKKGYWQRNLHLCNEKTAFWTGQVLWQIMIWSFGLCNAPET
jgi:hypothetical protein